MRRRRSETINAESFDEFLRLSLINASSKPRSRSLISESPLLSPSFLQNIENSSCEAKPDRSPKLSSNYWDDIDYANDEDHNSETLSSSLTQRSSVNLSEGIIEEREGDIPPLKLITFSIMIIGTKGTGRHQFVNSLFEPKNSINTQFQNSFDLVIHRKVGPESAKVFKFWIKDAETAKYPALYKVYYQTASILAFVYQVHDRNSFLSLEQAIQEAKQNLAGKELNGILIGRISNVQGKNKRKVQYEEGDALRKKYGLKMFIEREFIYHEENEDAFESLISK